MEHSHDSANVLVSLVVQGGYFALATPTAAQTPVVDLQSDLDVVGIHEALDVPGANSWFTRASMPSHRFDFAIDAFRPSIIAAPLIYAAGGKDFRDSSPISTLEAYDPVA